MAKTFKNTNVQPAPNLPDSKKDIIDFFEEDKKLMNTSVVQKTEEMNSALKKIAEEIENDPEDVRQTFIIGKQYLESIKDFVYSRRTKGHYEYSQRNCIEEALDLLFKISDFTERPDSVKEKEDKRREKIKRGIRS